MSGRGRRGPPPDGLAAFQARVAARAATTPTADPAEAAYLRLVSGSVGGKPPELVWRVLRALLELGGPATTPEVAGRAGVPNHAAHAALRKCEGAGVERVAGGRGTRTGVVWRFSEPAG